MKKILNLLGLYTEKDLVDFGNIMYLKTKKNSGVTDPDIQNFKHKLINGNDIKRKVYRRI
jgi:hypothetical protein